MNLSDYYINSPLKYIIKSKKARNCKRPHDQDRRRRSMQSHKVVLCGDVFVGKSAIFMQAQHGEHREHEL